MTKCTEKICVTFDLSAYVSLNLEIKSDDESYEYSLIEEAAEDIATQLLNTSFKKRLLELFKKALDENPYIEVGYAEKASNMLNYPTLTKEEIQRYLQETDA